jgi:hypothetical protein
LWEKTLSKNASTNASELTIIVALKMPAKFLAQSPFKVATHLTLIMPGKMIAKTILKMPEKIIAKTIENVRINA